MINFFLREQGTGNNPGKTEIQEIISMTRSVRTEQNEAILERLSKKIKSTNVQTNKKRCARGV